MRPEKQSVRSHRKDEHLFLAEKFYNEQQKNDFDKVHLIRPTLPETFLSQVDLSTTLFGKKVAAPIIINAMTGGSPTSTLINEQLAKIANRLKIGIASGSASIIVNEPDQLKSFQVIRKNNPYGLFLLNLNPEIEPKKVKSLVKKLSPDALQIHVNSVQETVMPEGDANFNWLKKIIAIKDAIDIPVIVKEVGFGFDPASITMLVKNGIEFIDVAGSGGTNFVTIENERRKDKDFDYLNDIGLSTVKSMLNINKQDISFISSGGIRNPMDILKSLAFGATGVGVSNQFLHQLQSHDADYLENYINNWIEQLADLFNLFGINQIADATRIKKYLDADLMNYYQQMKQDFIL